MFPFVLSKVEIFLPHYPSYSCITRTLFDKSTFPWRTLRCKFRLNLSRRMRFLRLRLLIFSISFLRNTSGRFRTWRRVFSRIAFEENIRLCANGGGGSRSFALHFFNESSDVNSRSFFRCLFLSARNLFSSLTHFWRSFIRIKVPGRFFRNCSLRGSKSVSSVAASSLLRLVLVSVELW